MKAKGEDEMILSFHCVCLREERRNSEKMITLAIFELSLREMGAFWYIRHVFLSNNKKILNNTPTEKEDEASRMKTHPSVQVVVVIK